MEISREEFVKKIHKKNYNEDIDNELIIKDPIISIPLDERDMAEIVDDLLIKINFLMPIELNEKMTKLDLIKLIQDSNALTTNWDNEPVFALHYNRIYDFYIDNKHIDINNRVKVYRVEGDSGKGIYMDLSGKDLSITSEFDVSNSTPAPMEDGGLKSIFGARKYVTEDYQKQWFFGFKDKEQLLDWFKSEEGMIEYIEKHGNAKVVEYEVNYEDVISGEFQTAFKKANAEKITSYPIADTNIKKTIKEVQLKFKF